MIRYIKPEFSIFGGIRNLNGQISRRIMNVDIDVNNTVNETH